MRSILSRALPLLAALCIAVGGCAESVAPEAPALAAPEEAPRALLVPLLVDVLQRGAPLARDYTASATIGEAGGTIRIPEAGFTITFPAGAVHQPVAIRATALAGRSVAYRFEPHGLVFDRDPVITQELGVVQSVTRLLGLSLEGGYFTDESLLAGGTGVILETRPARLDLLRLRMSFSIEHFSGYLASSGRRGGYISSSGSRAPAQRR